MAETRIYLKQQEAVTLRFTVQDKYNRGTVDLLTAVGCTFTAKVSPYASAPTISKAATGSTVELAAGVVLCTLSQSDLNIAPGLYYGELFMDISSTNRRKSSDILLDVRRSIT